MTALPSISRPTRAVTLPGGTPVTVRALTLAELRRVDADAEALHPDDAGERGYAVMAAVTARAVVGVAGAPVALDPADVAELLTPDQVEAVFKAATGRDKDAAKNA